MEGRALSTRRAAPALSTPPQVVIGGGRFRGSLAAGKYSWPVPRPRMTDLGQSYRPGGVRAGAAIGVLHGECLRIVYIMAILASSAD